jgi:origin recognition complex subunit 2
MKRRKQASELEARHDQEPRRRRSQSGSATETPIDGVALTAVEGSTSQRSRSSVEEVDSSGSDGACVESVDENQEAQVTEESETESTTHTPVKGASRLLKSGIQQNHLESASPTKRLLNKTLFSTPVKTDGALHIAETPRIERNADRSARRKSTRNLIERTILGNTSDNDEEDDTIARHIYDSEDSEDIDETEIPEQPHQDVSTPSKRGRPKGSKGRKRSPTPPQDLESHEKYFFQNRGGRPKTSGNDLSSLALLDHEEYFSRTRKMVDPHAEDIKFLTQLHTLSFNQWQFELSQNFNICIYGWGSKRDILMQFADYVSCSQAQDVRCRIVVVNGYVSQLTVRDILNTIASAIAERGHKLGSQPADMLEKLIIMLEGDKSQQVTLIINSIDKIPLRRPGVQTILSRLCSHPQLHLVASADHPSFPLLWDSSLRTNYNFIFHDCTTFQPYSAEIDVVDEVHELLGRSGRRVGGKEGVSFVLKSLPENAKNLFKVLIGEQLAAMEGNPVEAADDYDDEDNEQRLLNARKTEVGVEYRVLYQKAVEEFICSNEMNFRTLLKE